MLISSLDHGSCSNSCLVARTSPSLHLFVEPKDQYKMLDCEQVEESLNVNALVVVVEELRHLHFQFSSPQGCDDISNRDETPFVNFHWVNMQSQFLVATLTRVFVLQILQTWH